MGLAIPGASLEGAPGTPGATPVLQAGNAASLPPGSAPEVALRVVAEDTYAIDVSWPRAADGASGATPTLQVGNVTSLASGAAATAAVRAIGGNAYAIDIGVPVGASGGKGDTGATPTLQVGNVTALASGAAATAAVRALGGNAYAIDLGIPSGAPGATGATAWAPVATWQPNTNYTSIAPASVVTYDDGTGTQTYLAKPGVGAFTSGAVFNPANWVLIASHGLTGPLEARVAANEGAISGIQGQIQVPTLVIQAAAGEQGLRDALAIGLAKITAPATIVVVDIPAQPDIQLAAPIVLDSLEAPRFFIRAPAPDLIPAPNGIVSAVAAGANNVWGTPLYDVTFSTAAAHGLAAGDNVMVVGRSVNGAPTGAYQPLAGYHRVRAVPSATQVTFRIPSMVSMANLATALTGANSLSLTMHRFKVHLIAPLNNSVFSITNTRLLGMGNLGLECQASDNGVNAVPLFVRGVSTQIATMGSLGIRGGATCFNLLNGAVMKFGGPSASIVPSPDWIFALTGASNGCVVNVGTYFDANNSTSFSSCGHSLDAVYCQSSEADFPLLGMYGGNGQGALRAIKRVRAFFRINTIPLGIGSNVGNAGNQIYADAVSYIDCQGLNTNIAVAPAPNAIGNNGSYVSR